MRVSFFVKNITNNKQFKFKLYTETKLSPSQKLRLGSLKILLFLSGSVKQKTD